MKWYASCICSTLLLSLLCPHLLAQSLGTSGWYAEVPFDLVHGTVLLQATVNGRGPYWVMLDTGADPSLVDMKIAKEVKLKLARKGEQGSGGGTTVNLAYRTVLPRVQIGDLTATHVAALGMDLSKISAALGRPVALILGYSLMQNRILQIDYPKRKVRFLRVAPSCPEPLLHKPQCTELQFQYKDDILASGVTVNGKPAIANIDTGSNSTFQIGPFAIDKLGLQEDVARAHPSTSVGFNGSLNRAEGTVRHVTVGSFSAEGPAVAFFGKGVGVDDEPWDIRVGSGFLKDYVLTLDFLHDRIVLNAD
jgi:hypothetical protein